MPNTINFFDSYVLQALVEEIVPRQTFFKDRYFPTAPEDVFAADKVLAEYQKGDRQMAPIVAPRAGDIAVGRTGYEIHEIQPAYIALSRDLTIDDLKKRGFGEALYHDQTPAQRAARLQLKDLSQLDARIVRREEWMAVQTMINNGCDMQEYIDETTKGDILRIRYYDGEASEHEYSVGTKWNAEGGDFFGDVRNMCRLLSNRGLPAADLILGSDVAEVVLNMEKVQRLLDKNSGIIIGQISQELSAYDGVVYMGTLNFGGFKLNLICVDETYADEKNVTGEYFPADAAMVTAPGCGHMMYGQITQIDYGNTDFTTYVAPRVSKFILKQEKDIRKLRLGTRPLAAPKNYCPYIYAAQVIG